MADHPVLQRYERECERIRQWVGQNPDHDPLPMNIALNGYRNPPPFDIRLAMLMDDMALAIRALSHAAGQDGEQCRAASGEPDAWLYEYEHDGESDHCLSRVRFLPSWVEAKRATENPLYLRALSRGAPEGFPGEFDTLRAFAVEQHEAFDRYCAAIAAQRKEGE